MKIKNIKSKQAITIITLGFLSSCAMAQTEALEGSALMENGNNDYYYHDNGESKASDKAVDFGEDGSLVQIGKPQAHLHELRGFAKDLPLIAVLKQITPNGWMVKKKDVNGNRLDVQQMVSWKGGRNWVETLSDLSHEYSLHTVVNWKKREVVLSPATETRKAKPYNIERKGRVSIEKDMHADTLDQENGNEKERVAITKKVVRTSVFELEGAETSKIADGNSQEFNEEKPRKAMKIEKIVKEEKVAPPVPVAVSWTLNNDKTLKENVIEWGKKAGYKVVWNGEDYPIDDIRTLNGEFDSDEGPIKQLSLDYGPKTRVQQPLSFQFFQNKTLVVENFKFEQRGYPQVAK